MTAMVEIPVEQARSFRGLLAAARQWEADLIPGTSTTAAPAMNRLRQAIASFERS